MTRYYVGLTAGSILALGVATLARYLSDSMPGDQRSARQSRRQRSRFKLRHFLTGLRFSTLGWRSLRESMALKTTRTFPPPVSRYRNLAGPTMGLARAGSFKLAQRIATIVHGGRLVTLTEVRTNTRSPLQ